MTQDAARRVSRRRNGLRSAGDRRHLFDADLPRRSSIRSTATTISRARCASCRTPPTALPRSPTAAARTRSRSSPASTSPRDPAFKGKKRELTAAGLRLQRSSASSIRRSARTGSICSRTTLVGLDEPLARARKTGTFDYDAKIEGLQALDRYTLRDTLQASPITASSGGSRRATSRRSRARSSRSTATRRTA